MTLAEWADTPTPPALLSARERKITKGWPHWRTHEFTCGRITAKASLVRYLGAPPDNLEILTARNGAPDLHTSAPDRPCQLSISHCGDTVAVAVGPASSLLGIDIERRDARNAPLARRLTTAADEIETAPPPTAIIACKEAAFKACDNGRSLATSYPLRALVGRRITVHPRGPGAPGELLVSLTRHRDMEVSVASTHVARPRVLLTTGQCLMEELTNTEPIGNTLPTWTGEWR
ncbi:4'-phosphopantetheinyl transferase family protein [Streptomyces sp. NPDC055239]